MGRKNPLLTFALCTSLTVHLLGLAELARWYVAHTPDPKWAAIDREKLLAAAIPQARLTTPPPKLPPPQQPKKKRELPKFDMNQPPDPPRDDSGEAKGKGTANRSSPGDRPMQARSGYEQADLMRDMPDPSQLDPDSPLPAAAGAEKGTNAVRQSNAQLGRYTPDFVAESQAIPTPNADPSKPTVSRQGVGPLPLTLVDRENIPVPSGSPKKPVVMATANARQTQVPQAIRGHRANSSDTESVAFAKANTVTIHDGRTEARQGLKVSTRIPRFGLASVHDAEVIGEFRLVIGAYIDADGNVTDTVILHSSGSTNIDLDYQNSIYEWTFEPPKDKDGHPMATQWAITCD